MTSMKHPKQGLTRRQMAAGMAAAVPALAQEPPKPADDFAAAREANQRTVAALRKFKIPTLAEPSFIFRP